jgi:predicted dehydrogenase
VPALPAPGREMSGDVRIGQVGLGYWGRNLARVYDDVADLRWLCDASEQLREEFAHRHPNATVTGDFEEMISSGGIDAVVIATPVPTHYPLAKQALEAGLNVFVEKPPAMRVSEMEELIALAEAGGLVLMPGHLLLYHPAVQKLKELVDSGELGDVLVVYGNRQNLGKIRKDENALWSLGVHDLSVILYLIQEEIVEAAAHGHAFLNEGVEDVVFCYLRFDSGKIAHMHLSWLDPHKMRRLTVVGRDKMAVFDDMELDRKITVYDKAPEQPSDSYGEWRTRSGDIFSPKVPNDEPLKLECQHFVRLVQEGWDGREMHDGLEVVRALELLTESLRG